MTGSLPSCPWRDICCRFCQTAALHSSRRRFPHKLIGLIQLSIVVLTVLLTFIPPLCKASTEPAHLLSAEERAWLQANRDRLPLFFSTDFPPIEYLSPQGRFAGLGADIIAEIEQFLDIRFLQQPTKEWKAVLRALESSVSAVTPTIVRTDDRERYALFTAPYVTIPVVIITNRAVRSTLTLDDLTGKRVAVVSGFVTEDYVRTRSQGKFKVIIVTSVLEGLRQLSFGQVDAFIENVAVAAHTITHENLPNLRVAGNTDLTFPLSIAVSRQAPLLYSAIVKALAAIPPARMNQLRTKWIALEVDSKIRPETLRLLILIAIFSGLLLLGLTVITLLLKRRLNEKVDRLRVTQQDLHASEKKYRELVENAVSIILRVDTQLRITFVNEYAQRFFGFTQTELLGRPLVGSIIPEQESSGRVLSALMEALRARPEDFSRMENENMCRDGARVWVAWANKPIYDSEGQLTGLLCVGSDITERKQSEAEREKLQAQLLLAHKMESVGRLAGGVAHDFNNMLSAIAGYTELSLKKIDPTSPVHGYLEQVLDAAERSTNLIRQLLAFARQQKVHPAPLDLNNAVESMLKMLNRLIGEDIFLVWQPQSGLWPILMDPTQVDQILANLCVNARDAIGGVGKVTIKTANTVFDETEGKRHSGHLPGEYVMLAVTDTGCGMDTETLANIFDPFFTTKEDEGTGLGLATIYGIVQQNSGFVTVDSAPGKGSTFSIYLPRHADEPIVEKEVVGEQPVPQSQGETVLLVEDEPNIMDMTKVMLETLGYRVLTACSPEDAMAMAQIRGGMIDLLITDVIMPRMDGRRLANHLLAMRPQMRCLFMSGYPIDAIAHYGVQDVGVHFIQKPFSLRSLADKVREVLGNS